MTMAIVFWILLVVAVIGLFVLWDLIFCNGKRCREFIDRMS